MDLMSVLTAVTHPGVDPEVPDPRDPATAAVFTELLAGLLVAAVPTGAVGDGTAAAPAGVAEGSAAAVTAGATGAAAGPHPAQADALALADQIATGTLPGEAAAGDVGLPSGSTIAAPALVPQSPPSSSAPAPVAVPGARQPAGDELAGAGETTEAPPVEPTGIAGITSLSDGVADAAAEAETAGAPAPRAAPSATAPDLAVTADPASTSTTDVSPTASSEASLRSAITGAVAPDSADDSGSDPTDSGDAGVQAMDATSRTATTAPAAAGSAPAETAGARVLERALAMQLAHRVGTLSQRSDGEYDLTLQLEPADLGRLELRVRMEGGLVHIQIGAHAASTTEALRSALPELRAALADAGLTPGSLDVGTHAGQSGSGASRDPLERQAHGAVPQPNVGTGPDRPVPITTLPTLTGAARGVDVLL